MRQFVIGSSLECWSRFMWLSNKCGGEIIFTHLTTHRGRCKWQNWPNFGEIPRRSSKFNLITPVCALWLLFSWWKHLVLRVNCRRRLGFGMRRLFSHLLPLNQSRALFHLIIDCSHFGRRLWQSLLLTRGKWVKQSQTVQVAQVGNTSCTSC